MYQRDRLEDEDMIEVDQEKLNKNHSSPESLYVDCVFDDVSVKNMIIGSNRKIKVVPVENLSIIYNIYSTVRANFIKCWRTILSRPAIEIKLKISTCLTMTLKMTIQEYYKTNYGQNYFEIVEFISCNNKLFTQCQEWVMPATDITETGGRKLYLLVDRFEIERFITYYLYVYLKSGSRISIEFDTVCDKIKNLKRKLPGTYLDGTVQSMISKTTTKTFKTEEIGVAGDQEADLEQHNSVVFYFTLLCIDKTISIINNMIICSGSVPRNIYTSTAGKEHKKTIRTSILDTLDVVTISVDPSLTVNGKFTDLNIIAEDTNKIDSRDPNRGISIYKSPPPI